jgi:hypothetical protein
MRGDDGTATLAVSPVLVVALFVAIIAATPVARVLHRHWQARAWQGNPARVSYEAAVTTWFAGLFVGLPVVRCARCLQSFHLLQVLAGFVTTHSDARRFNGPEMVSRIRLALLGLVLCMPLARHVEPMVAEKLGATTLELPLWSLRGELKRYPARSRFEFNRRCRCAWRSRRRLAASCRLARRFAGARNCPRQSRMLYYIVPPQ